MIWLIGCGAMAVDYSRVLDAQNHNYLIIGRGQKSADSFKEQTGKKVELGGLESFLLKSPAVPRAVIVSVAVEHLYAVTLQLLEYGVKAILVEKPGATTEQELVTLNAVAEKKNANIYIAYNRRFYASVLAARDLIKKEGGVTSFNFELTEWSHVIEKLDKPKEVFAKWFLANSTHVADLAFFLGGVPKDISTYTTGSLEWHPSAAVFAGAGITNNNALFTYSANWKAAGRWSVEILTNENRYIFRPLETLQVQKTGTIPHVIIEIDDKLDKEFKPGLYRQVEAFLNNDNSLLCDVKEQLELFKQYEKMANYVC